jgi:hypothetical protein
VGLSTPQGLREQGVLPLPGWVSLAPPGRVPAIDIMMPLASGALPGPTTASTSPAPAASLREVGGGTGPAAGAAGCST